MLKLYWFFISSICLGYALAESQYESFQYMSDLSKYEANRGDVRLIQVEELNGCTPINFWMLHRHGTRYPTSGEIAPIESLAYVRDAALENHKNGRGTLTQAELERLGKWTFDSSIESIQAYLTPEGYNETFRTSTRYKERFPSLLNREYSQKDFYFQHSDTQRTLVTSYAFIDGLFGENRHESVVDLVTPADSDYLLYDFGGACKKLTEELSNPNTMASSNSFLETEDALEAIEAISKRLGFEETLPVTNITAIFGACGYDSAWFQETEWLGAWCAALGHEGRKIGEYYLDLEFQAISGYGDEVTERGGCGPPKDLWERFATATGELSIEDKTESFVGLFSHDNMIMMVHSSLGLLKDDPLISADNYRSQGDRQWRTSKIVPFAANIAAVLHECPNPRKKPEYKVLFLRNEKILEGIPNCPNGVCTWENFRNFVKPVAENCIYDEFC